MLDFRTYWIFVIVAVSYVYGQARHRSASDHESADRWTYTNYRGNSSYNQHGSSQPHIKDVHISEAYQQPPKQEPAYSYKGRASAWNQNNGQTNSNPAQQGNNWNQQGNNWNQQGKPTMSYKGRNANLNSGTMQSNMNQNPTNWLPPNHPSTWNQHQNMAAPGAPLNSGIIPFIDPDLPDGLDDLWEMQQKHSAVQHMMNTNPGLAQQMMAAQNNLQQQGHSQGQQQGQPKPQSGPGNVRIYNNPNTDKSNAPQWNQQTRDNIPQRANFEHPQQTMRTPNPEYARAESNGTQVGMAQVDLRDQSHPQPLALRNQWYRKRGRQDQLTVPPKPTTAAPSGWNQQPNQVTEAPKSNTPPPNGWNQQKTHGSNQQNHGQGYLGRSHFINVQSRGNNQDGGSSMGQTNNQQQNGQYQAQPNHQGGGSSRGQINNQQQNGQHHAQPYHQGDPYQQQYTNPWQQDTFSQHQQPPYYPNQREGDEDQKQDHPMYQDTYQGSAGPHHGPPVGWNDRRPEMSEFNAQDGTVNNGPPQKQSENENEGQYITRPNVAPSQYHGNQYPGGQGMHTYSFWPSNGPGPSLDTQQHLMQNGPQTGRFNGHQPQLGPNNPRQEWESERESEQENEGQRSFHMTRMDNTRISDSMLQEYLNERLKQRGDPVTGPMPWGPIPEGGYTNNQRQRSNVNHLELATGSANQKLDRIQNSKKGNTETDGRIPAITGRDVWVDPKNQKEIVASRMKPNVLDDILDQFLLGGADEIDTPYGKIERENNGGYEIEGPLLRMILEEIRQGKRNETTLAFPYDLEHRRKFAGFHQTGNHNQKERTSGKQRERTVSSQRSQSSQEVSSTDPDQQTLDPMAVWDSLPIHDNANMNRKPHKSVNITMIPTTSHSGEATTGKPKPPSQPVNKPWVDPHKSGVWQNPSVPNVNKSPWDPINPQGRQPWNSDNTQEGSGMGSIQFPTLNTQNITKQTPANGSLLLEAFNVSQIIQTPNEDPLQIKQPPPMAARIIQLPEDTSTMATVRNVSTAVPKMAVESRGSGSAFSVIIITLVVMGCLIAPAACIVWRIRKKRKEEKLKNLKDNDCWKVAQDVDIMVRQELGKSGVEMEKLQGARRKTYIQEFTNNMQNARELQPLNSSVSSNIHEVIVHQTNEVL